MVSIEIRLIVFFFAAEDGKSLYSQQKQDLELTCSDHQLLQDKIEKVGKTTRPVIYDLNQIPYAYIVEVTNRFNGLDLVDRVIEELSHQENWRYQGNIPHKDGHNKGQK